MSLDKNLTPAELLETAEELFATKNQNMYRAAILEAITALEAKVRDKAFPALKERVGFDLTKWLEEKTRMDFDTRLGLFIPLMTGLKIDKKDKLWNDYKKAKEIRNKVTHSGVKVTESETRFVINTIYEWIEYLNQAQEVTKDKNIQNSELLGRFIQASARLERVIYSTLIKSNVDEKRIRPLTSSLNELFKLSLIDVKTFHELNQLRMLRNKAVHSHPSLEIANITEDNVQRLNNIIDDIERKLA